MNFPLPIRSFTSSTDFSTPLFVETNIVYNMEETKFPGLHESSHSSEPALLIDSNISLNTCNSWTELCDICDVDNPDHNKIRDSLVIQDIVFPSIDDILDLPDIQLELPKYDAPVNETNQVIVPSACAIGDSTHLLSSNVTETQIDTTISPLCESYRFSNPMKRQRNVSFSLHQDITNYNSTEYFGCSKRRKSSEFNFSTHSLENYFESGIHETSMFHFGLSPIKSLSDRQW